MTARIILDIARANAMARQHGHLTMKIGAWFERRYGCVFNDVDADELIDCVDYGKGGCPGSIAEIDAIMRLAGKEPLSDSKGSVS